MRQHDVRRLAAVALVGLTAVLTACSASSSAGGAAPGASAVAPTPSTSLSPSAGTSPSPAVSGKGPAAPVVPGYTLEPAPADALGAFQQLASNSPDVYTGVSAFTVKKGTKEIGGLILFGVDTGGTTSAALAQKLVQSIATGLAGTGDVTTQTIAGTKVVWTESGTSSATAIWYQNQVLAMVIGASRAQLTPFVAGAIQAG